MITVSTPVDLLGLVIEAAGEPFVVGLEAVLGVEVVGGCPPAVLDRLVAGRAVPGALIEPSLAVGSTLGLVVGLWARRLVVVVVI